MKEKAKFLAIILIACVIASTAIGETIYVDDVAGGTNDGSSWADAYNDLQDALAVAQFGDEIRAAQGIYKPDEGIGITPGDREATFQLINGVTLKGSYAGAGEVDPDARDIELYETILNGDLAGNDGPNLVNYGDNSYHMVTGSGTDDTAILDGFTITGGNADGSYPYSYGSGMYNYGGSPTLMNCTFDKNSTEYGGGGMCNDYKSHPTLTNCTFSSNSAGAGGGMYNRSSKPTLMNCTFSRNLARHGGGMYNLFEYSSPTLTNCTFNGNSAIHSGGGMLNSRSNPILTNCTFTENSASSGSGMNGGGTLNNCTFSRNHAGQDGGGIRSGYYSHPIATNCIFTNNSAGRNGGGLYNNGKNTLLTNCIFSENLASSDGGGMYNDISSPILTNCTFSRNSAFSDGGGLYIISWGPILKNCTFSGNTAHEIGGGMVSRGSSPQVTNCTFVDNSASNGNALACDFYSQQRTSNLQVTNCILWDGGNEIWNNDDSTISITYSDVQDNWPGEGNIDAEPCFADPCAGDYHLLAKSPCINTGDPHYVPSLGETDMDGEARVMGGQVDMGIDEFTSTLTPILGIWPTELQFHLYADIHDLESQLLTICNTGSGTMDWSISENCPWLELYPTNGTSIGEVNEVNVIVDISKLKPGEYNYEFMLTADGAVNSPLMVPVSLYVYESGKLHVPSEYETIQEAIDFALDGAIVIVADGTHTGPGNRDIDFTGKAITVRSENGGENCIIDCQGTESEPHRAFIFQNGEGPDSIVNGLTIINGYEEQGGAIYCSHSSPTVSNCTFSGNRALAGGGMYNSYSSNTTVSKCKFRGNSASNGGGIYNYEGYPALTNCIFSGNLATEYGGAIYLSYYTYIFVNNCTFTGNWAGEAGGGIYIHPPPVPAGETPVASYDQSIITHCIFWENPGQIGADPCFVDPGYWDANEVWVEGDYHLLPDSPHIDAGNPDYPYDPNETDLDGNPRVLDGNGDGIPVVDMGAYEFTSIQAEVRITPRTINLASKGKWITCYIWLPDDYSVADIDSNSIFLYGKIQADSVQLNEKQQVAIAEFSREEVKTILNIDKVELSIIGWLMDGTIFEGKDIIKVENKSSGKHDKYVQASSPNPPDEATSVSTYTDLSWTASPSATSHDVYFGTSSTPPFIHNQTDTTFDPGWMDSDRTYYWRIDEVHKWGKTTGQLWSFTTIEGPGPPPPP